MRLTCRVGLPCPPREPCCVFPLRRSRRRPRRAGSECGFAVMGTVPLLHLLRQLQPNAAPGSQAGAGAPLPLC
jgi:hypothetical protein